MAVISMLCQERYCRHRRCPKFKTELCATCFLFVVSVMLRHKGQFYSEHLLIGAIMGKPVPDKAHAGSIRRIAQEARTAYRTIILTKSPLDEA